MEAVRTSETSVNLNLTTRRYIPEDSKLHLSVGSEVIQGESQLTHITEGWTDRQKLKSFLRYGNAQNCRIRHRLVQRFSQQNFAPSPYLRASLNKIVIKMKLVCMYVHDFILPKFICLSATVHELPPLNKILIFNFQPSFMLVFLCFSQKYSY
jgi:hypothetical protein